ncbi:MAG: ABC transporter superfamily protein [Amphiamblys sp. WSBS2006]|nr:MAG: ABC transporter superfamily protein [Amphiamblys sp. WSBS2006]
MLLGRKRREGLLYALVAANYKILSPTFWFFLVQKNKYSFLIEAVILGGELLSERAWEVDSHGVLYRRHVQKMSSVFSRPVSKNMFRQKNRTFETTTDMRTGVSPLETILYFIGYNLYFFTFFRVSSERMGPAVVLAVILLTVFFVWRSFVQNKTTAEKIRGVGKVKNRNYREMSKGVGRIQKSIFFQNYLLKLYCMEKTETGFVQNFIQHFSEISMFMVLLLSVVFALTVKRKEEWPHNIVQRMKQFFIVEKALGLFLCFIEGARTWLFRVYKKRAKRRHRSSLRWISPERGVLVKVENTYGGEWDRNSVLRLLGRHQKNPRFFGISGRISGTVDLTGPFSTIRRAITFHERYSEERYRKVLEITRVRHRLSQLKKKDTDRFVGNEDELLSRMVSFARCLYKEADIYVLAVPFLELDEETERRMAVECFVEFLSGKTRIVFGQKQSFDGIFDMKIELKEKPRKTLEEPKYRHSCVGACRRKPKKENGDFSLESFATGYLKGTMWKLLASVYRTHKKKLALFFYFLFGFLLRMRKHVIYPFGWSWEGVVVCVFISGVFFLAKRKLFEYLLDGVSAMECSGRKIHLENKYLHRCGKERAKIFSQYEKEHSSKLKKEQMKRFVGVFNSAEKLVLMWIYLRSFRFDILLLVVVGVIAVFPPFFNVYFRKDLARLERKCFKTNYRLKLIYMQSRLFSKEERRVLFKRKYLCNVKKLFAHKKKHAATKQRMAIFFSLFCFCVLFLFKVVTCPASSIERYAPVPVCFSYVVYRLVQNIADVLLIIWQNKLLESKYKKKIKDVGEEKIHLERIESVKLVDVVYRGCARRTRDKIDLEIKVSPTAILFPDRSEMQVFLDAVFGVVAASKGSVQFDSVPSTKLSRKTLREVVGIVDHRTSSIPNTVREWIDWKQEYDESILHAVLDEIGMGHLLKRGGPPLYRSVEKDSDYLLRYEKLLLQIAFFILNRPSVLFLVDVFTGLSEGECVVVESVIEKHFSDCLVVHVGSFYSFYSLPAYFCSIEGGRVAEKGVPTELLLRRDSLFSSLANSKK